VITVYTQPGCAPCKRVIEVLRGNLTEGDEFKVVDITEDREAREYVVEGLGAKSTPVIESDYDGGNPIIGFGTPDDRLRLLYFIDEESN